MIKREKKSFILFSLKYLTRKYANIRRFKEKNSAAFLVEDNGIPINDTDMVKWFWLKISLPNWIPSFQFRRKCCDLDAMFANFLSTLFPPISKYCYCLHARARVRTKSTVKQMLFSVCKFVWMFLCVFLWIFFFALFIFRFSR